VRTWMRRRVIVLKEKMIASGKKTRLSLSFNEYEMALIEKTAAMILKYHDHPCFKDDKQKNYRRVLRLAVLAYTRGVIIGGISDDYVSIAKLRPETKEECDARCNRQIPSSNNNDWRVPNRFN